MEKAACFVSDSRRLHPHLFPAGALSGEAVPLRLPHFQLRDGALYFLTSPRVHATLTADEQALWEAIDGTASVLELRGRFGAAADGLLDRFLKLMICEMAPAVFPAGRRRVLVIEPHMDDAALSVGGLMWQRRHRCEFIIVTLVGISNFTTQGSIGREYFDRGVVSQLRKAESALHARHLGALHACHQLREAPLRYSEEKWSLEWFQRHKKAIFAFVNHTASPDEHEPWAAAIGEAITEHQPQEIWLPLGLGFHVDHELTRSGYLALMSSQPALFQGKGVKLYQDVPYASIAPNHAAELVGTLREAGAQLDEEKVDITADMEMKLQLLTVFRSQFKIDPIRVRVERCARAAAAQPGRFAETLYNLRRLPLTAIDPVAAIARKESAYRLADQVAPWLKRNAAAPVITILTAVGVGRWREDVQYLLDTFPDTRFEIHVPAECEVETKTLLSPRVTTHTVANRWKGWFFNAVKSMLRCPGPVVLISGGDDPRQKRYADYLSLLGVGADSLVSPTMNDFIVATRIAAAAASHAEKGLAAA